MSQPIFKSKLEELMPAEELLFEPTPAFGKYKHFLEHAISHPAKANTRLLEFLVEKFTEEGDTVLDPMAGSGSTGVVAALRGRNAVQVELEPKFYEWMEKARENVEKHPTLTPKGKIVNICGDARRLSKLLSQADTVITSPPYTNSAAENPNVIELQKKGWVKGGDLAKFLPQNLSLSNIGNLPLGSISTIITSPPFAESLSKNAGGMAGKWDRDGTSTKKKLPCPYSANDDNIGNLPYIDTVITSPPYLDVDNVKPKSEEFWQNAQKAGKRWGSKPPAGTDQKQTSSPENIGNLPLGDVELDETIKRLRQHGRTDPKAGGPYGRSLAHPYSPNPENIGNLPFQPDAIITSPPYERQLHDSREKRAAGAWNGSELDVEKNLPMGYSENPENIGNLRKETYLEAMLKVYGEMFKVLKPGGRAIVIVKPFVRNKRVVDLPWHTWLLMYSVGFVLEKLYKLRLQNVSFWRILYQKKYPEVPRICHEYILVCRKP